MSTPKLTPKQAAFVQEYLVDLNATQAAKRAGYSERTASRTGSENLSKPVIAAAIAKAQTERANRTQVTADRVVEELAKIGFSNLLDYFSLTSDGEPYVDLSTVTREQAAVLAELQVDDFLEGRGDDAREVRRVKVKLHDKLKALEQLAKHLGIADKVDITSGGEKLKGSIVNVYLPENGRGDRTEGES